MSGTSSAEHRAACATGRVLRVVNWHNTPAAQEAQLREELSSYAARFTPVALRDLDAWFDAGAAPGGRPGFVPVFYDGYRNGAEVAARVCDELGLRAAFFPPTAFLSAPAADQRSFAGAHHIDLVPEEGDRERLAMTWDELGGIAERHDVCGHTATHAEAASVTTAEDVAREVTEPLRLLEQRCAAPPLAWAWLRGTPHDPASTAWRAAVDAGVRYAVSNTMVERLA